MRIVTLLFTVVVTLYAVNSKDSIFKMVENAYQVTLVAAFVPLMFGLFWKRATNQGALMAIFCGLFVWLSLLLFGPEDPLVPAQFAGLLASAGGMIAGSLLPQAVGGPHLTETEHAILHHHAAAETHQVGEHPHRHTSSSSEL